MKTTSVPSFLAPSIHHGLRVSARIKGVAALTALSCAILLAACGNDTAEDDLDADDGKSSTSSTLRSKCNAFCKELVACPGEDDGGAACDDYCDDVIEEADAVRCTKESGEILDCMVGLNLCSADLDDCADSFDSYSECFNDYCQEHADETPACGAPKPVSTVVTACEDLCETESKCGMSSSCGGNGCANLANGAMTTDCEVELTGYLECQASLSCYDLKYDDLDCAAYATAFNRCVDTFCAKNGTSVYCR